MDHGPWSVSGRVPGRWGRWQHRGAQLLFQVGWAAEATGDVAWDEGDRGQTGRIQGEGAGQLVGSGVGRWVALET